MQKNLKLLLQYISPQHTLSRLLGWLCDCRWPPLKNWMINRFIRVYAVNLHEVEIESPTDYINFNHFFTRLLKPECRPMTNDPMQLACPVDGSISQIGKIEQGCLLQAKGFDYSLSALLGGSEMLAQLFSEGQFATLYLSPKDYHRVHMPYTGKLRETLFVPGQLFSVNRETTLAVPNLFARNERLVCIFDTDIGPMAVILVGAMLVGSINTVWDDSVTSPHTKTQSYHDGITLTKGSELGHFKMGSTVILLFEKDRVTWSTEAQEGSLVRMGQPLGAINVPRNE